MLQLDFVLTVDPWLTYEAHHDHIQTGLAVAEAVMFTGLTKIPSSDLAVDAAFKPHDIKGIIFYHTREPNQIMDISETWEAKLAAVRCYEAQFTSQEMNQLVRALDMKAQQVAGSESFKRGESLKVLHTSALHCGF